MREDNDIANVEQQERQTAGATGDGAPLLMGIASSAATANAPYQPFTMSKRVETFPEEEEEYLEEQMQEQAKSNASEQVLVQVERL